MRRKRRIIGWLACMAVAVASIGVPLPVLSAKKPSAAPFPCQHCACGCTDAETCWRDCCCFTNRQKLAWAKRNGVKPPALVVAAARREARESSAPPCCAARIAASGPRTCCKSTPSCCEGDPPPPVAAITRSGGSPRVAQLNSKLRCRGLGLSASGLPPSIPCESPSSAPAPRERGEHRPHEPLLYEPPFLAVSTPPPDAPRV